MKYRTVLRIRAVLTSRPSAAKQTHDSFTPFQLPPCVISLPAIFWDPHVNARVTPHHPGLWVSRHAECSSLQSAETNTSNLLLVFLPFYRGGQFITGLFLYLARQCMEWSVSTNIMCWWKATGTSGKSWRCTTNHEGTKPMDITVLKMWTFSPKGLLSLCSGGFTSDIYFKGHWERGFRTHLQKVQMSDIKAIETHSHFRLWWDDAGNLENIHTKKWE
jgi:hypothetical protein